jgi:hypothetical protein
LPRRKDLNRELSKAIVCRQHDDAENETRFDRLPEDLIDSHFWLSRKSASPNGARDLCSFFLCYRSTGEVVAAVCGSLVVPVRRSNSIKLR